MCLEPDSEPPIAPLAGAAIEHEHVVLEAADGNRLAAFAALAPQPAQVGMLVLPDVRGLFSYYEELAHRFAEAGVAALAIDYYGRTAGASRRDATFEFAPHVPRSTWAGLQADVAAAAAHLRTSAGIRRLYSIGYCYGGGLSLLLAGLPELALDGVIGFYGWPVGTFRNDMPAPADVAAGFRAPVLALFGGADAGISADDVTAFEQALERAPVAHRVVTYPGAPHSFFDRKQAEFAEPSAQAWSEVRAFIGLPGSAARGHPAGRHRRRCSSGPRSSAAPDSGNVSRARDGLRFALHRGGGGSRWGFVSHPGGQSTVGTQVVARWRDFPGRLSRPRSHQTPRARADRRSRDVRVRATCLEGSFGIPGETAADRQRQASPDRGATYTEATRSGLGED